MDFIRSLKNDIGAHLGPLPRETASPFPVQTIGYMPEKRTDVRLVFKSYNFSFILQGGGFFRYRERLWPVSAPCVLTQWPGQEMYYGPEGSWEEVFIIYDAALMPALASRGFIAEGRPFWPVSRPDALQGHLQLLARSVETLAEPFGADRVDLACEMLILESLSRRSSVRESREEQAVRAVENRMRLDPCQDFDIDALAHENGMHPATFRRKWNSLNSLPPGRFLARLRIHAACRMLVETSLTVSEIASAVRIDAPLYFSRCSTREIGCAATAYRRRYRTAQLFSA